MGDLLGKLIGLYEIALLVRMSNLMGTAQPL